MYKKCPLSDWCAGALFSKQGIKVIKGNGSNKMIFSMSVPTWKRMHDVLAGSIASKLHEAVLKRERGCSNMSITYETTSMLGLNFKIWGD